MLAGVGEYDEDGGLRRVPAVELRVRRGRRSTAGRWWCRVTTSPCAAARPTRRCRRKRNNAEGLALELRLPHVRLVDGMGGGGSVKTIETVGRTYISQMRGWETVVAHLSVAPSVSLALGSVAGIGAARVATSHYSVIVRGTAQMMIAGPGPGRVRRRGASPRTSSVSRIHTTNGAIDDGSTPRTRRSPWPGGSCRTCRPAWTSCRRGRRRTDDPDRRDERARCRSCPATRAGSTRCARSSRRWSTAARSSRSAASGASRSSPAWPASTAGRWRCSPRTPTSTAAPGRRTRRRRSRASSTWRRRSTCRSSTSWTAPAS